MNILIDIGHPAHVHLFKNFAWIMQKKGHKTLFTAREKEHTIKSMDWNTNPLEDTIKANQGKYGDCLNLI
jgi:predicted glycosyltransferase